MRSLVVVLWVVVGSSIAGCGGDSPSHVVSFVDASHRSCTVDIADISATATCDASASSMVTCAAGTEPGFEVTPNLRMGTSIAVLQNCAGCVDRAHMMTLLSAPTCADVSCTTSADCVYTNYTCVSGSCQAN